MLATATVATGPRLQWFLGFAVAAGLHIGVAAAVLSAGAEPDADLVLTGSYVVELAPSYTTAAVQPTPVTLGALSSESAESAPAVAATPPVPQQIELPSVERAPTEPDVALPEPTSKAEQKPAETEPTQSPTEQNVSSASIASQAAAPPRIDTPEAKTPTAPQVGISAQTQRAKMTWHKAVGMHLERFKRYPAAADHQRIPGTVLVEFSIDRDGLLTMKSIRQSSGWDMLDGAALDLLRRASPLPRPPKELDAASLTLTVPVVFKLP